MYGVGCMALDLSFRVSGVGCRCELQGVGYGVQGVGCWVWSVGCMLWGVGCRVKGVGVSFGL